MKKKCEVCGEAIGARFQCQSVPIFFAYIQLGNTNDVSKLTVCGKCYLKIRIINALDKAVERR